jgi:chorismate lyase
LRWFQACTAAPGRLPYAVRPWLLDESSLTVRLIACCDGQFSVRKLAHRWERPELSEQRLLDLPHGRVAMVRDVLLCCDARPMVFARSVLPLATLTGPLRHLRRLSNQSLGSFLFRQPSLQRTPFEVTRIEPGTGWLPAYLPGSGPRWARRSRFTVGGRPLLVTEVFLLPLQR